MDLLMMDTLRSLIEAERTRKAAATQAASQEAAVITEIRGLSERAKAELASGNVVSAEGLYTTALSRIPEVFAAHQYFTEKAAAEASARKTAAESILAQADASFKAGNYEAALSQYGKALSYLPQSAYQAENLADQYKRAGFETLAAEQRLRETRSAASILAEGNTASAEGNFDKAVTSYSNLVKLFPNSNQVPSALEGIRRVIESKQKIADEQGQKLNTRITELETDKQNLETARENLRKEHENKIRELSEQYSRGIEAMKVAQETENTLKAAESKQILENQKQLYEKEIADLQVTYNADKQRLEEEFTRGRLTMEEQLKARIQDLEAQVNAMKLASEETTVAIPTEKLSEEVKQELTRLSSIAEEYGRIKESYEAYVARENQIIQTKGDAALIEAKLYLDTFLATDEMRKSFPGLFDRIKKYDKAFQDAGRDDAILEISDMVYTLNRLKNTEDKKTYIAQASSRQNTSPAVMDFLKQLDGLIK